MDKFTKRSTILVIVLSVIFILLIPLGIFLESKFDAINTQLLLKQAADAASYSDMMGIKSALKTGIVIINVCKIFIGILMILLGITILNKNLPKKSQKKPEKIESKLNGEENE
ncbi:MAG: hypothetical protein MJ181_01965 [Treponema sp.]|nr:hypothetical protein [Treponema sp.]